MGTQFEEGQKPKNRITISKSSDSTVRLDPDSGKTDRSFAQPNPSVAPRQVDPKANASAQDQVEALNENSVEGRTYSQEEDDCQTSE